MSGFQQVLPNLLQSKALDAKRCADKPIVVAMFNVDMIGHCNPTFALVQQLVKRGCRVHYFLPPNDKLRSAASDAGAIVEGYQAGDPSDFILDECGELDGLSPFDAMQTWPLASCILCGKYLISRCKDLGVDIAVWDPMAPHGLLVSKALNIPGVSLVTFPGLGSVAALVPDSLAEHLREVRAPLGAKIKEEFEVDLQAELDSRIQWLAEENFVTTTEDLEVPLPEPGALKWADEVRQKFPMTTLGCMVNDTAPHVTVGKAKSARKESAWKTISNKLPVDDLKAAASRGAKVIFVALGTMALADRWAENLGMASGGNLPEGTTGKDFCHYIWKTAITAVRNLGDGYHCVLCIGMQADALDFLEGETEEEKLASLPMNVTLCTSVQQVEMLNNHADVFVTHAGFNSLQESLIAEVPMIAVPQAVDQPANARKVEAAGWGRAFLEPMSSVTPSSLQDALVETAAEKSSFREAVAVSGKKLSGGDVRAAERVIEIARAA